MNFNLVCLFTLVLMYCIWKGRMVLVSLGFKEYPRLTELIVSNRFVRLFFNKNDKEIIVKYLYNQHMLKLYSENTYLYYIPDIKKREKLDEYRVQMGLI